MSELRSRGTATALVAGSSAGRASGAARCHRGRLSSARPSPASATSLSGTMANMKPCRGGSGGGGDLVHQPGEQRLEELHPFFNQAIIGDVQRGLTGQPFDRPVIQQRADE